MSTLKMSLQNLYSEHRSWSTDAPNVLGFRLKTSSCKRFLIWERSWESHTWAPTTSHLTGLSSPGVKSAAISFTFIKTAARIKGNTVWHLVIESLNCIYCNFRVKKQRPVKLLWTFIHNWCSSGSGNIGFCFLTVAEELNNSHVRAAPEAVPPPPRRDSSATDKDVSVSPQALPPSAARADRAGWFPPRPPWDRYPLWSLQSSAFPALKDKKF